MYVESPYTGVLCCSPPGFSAKGGHTRRFPRSSPRLGEMVRETSGTQFSSPALESPGMRDAPFFLYALGNVRIFHPGLRCGSQKSICGPASGQILFSDAIPPPFPVHAGIRNDVGRNFTAGRTMGVGKGAAVPGLFSPGIRILFISLAPSRTICPNVPVCYHDPRFLFLPRGGGSLGGGKAACPVTGSATPCRFSPLPLKRAGSFATSSIADSGILQDRPAFTPLIFPALSQSVRVFGAIERSLAALVLCIKSPAPHYSPPLWDDDRISSVYLPVNTKSYRIRLNKYHILIRSVLYGHADSADRFRTVEIA